MAEVGIGKEKKRALGLTPIDALRHLGIDLLSPREGEDERSVALRTVQGLLSPMYEVLIREVGGTPAEDLKTVDPRRLENPQAFIDSTLALMTAHSGVQPNEKGQDISLSGALSVSCLMGPKKYPDETVARAKQTVSMDPFATALLPKLPATNQALPSK